MNDKERQDFEAAFSRADNTERICLLCDLLLDILAILNEIKENKT